MLRPARPYLVRHRTGHRGPRPRDRMPHDRLPAAAVSVPCCRIQRLDASPGGRRHHLHRHTGRQPPCDRPFEPRLRPQRRKPVLQTQLYERFQLRVLRPRRKRLGRYDRPRIFGALCLQKELLADDAPRQADAGQIHQRHHDRGKRHTLDRQPLQRPAGLQQPGIRNTVAYDGEQPAHAATRKQRHHGAPLRLIRAAVGQHRRPDRGVYHGTRKHPQPHAAARPGPCQPILRRRPPEGMGRHAFGTRLLGRDTAAGSRVQRVRRTGCRAARRLHDADRRVRTRYLHRRYPAIRRPALYRNGRQHDRHSPASIAAKTVRSGSVRAREDCCATTRSRDSEATRSGTDSRATKSPALHRTPRATPGSPPPTDFRSSRPRRNGSPPTSSPTGSRPSSSTPTVRSTRRR